MDKCRNVRIGEEVWVRLKQRALDERVTLREVVERAVHLYLGGTPNPLVERSPRSYGRPLPGKAERAAEAIAQDLRTGVKEFHYDPEG